MSNCDDRKAVVAKLAKDIDELILNEDEGEIERVIMDCNEKSRILVSGAQNLNDFFFIWLGRIRPAALEYIDVWREAVGWAGSVRIYYDSHFMLFNFHTQIFQLLHGISAATPVEEVVQRQNHFKREIDAFIGCGCSYDEALIVVAGKMSFDVAANLEKELVQARRLIARLEEKYTMVDVRDDMDVFFDPFFYRVYELELTLRANAAAAADILRLLLLYMHGGVFVDVDTLPSLLSVYGPLSDRASFNIQNIVRSEYFLRRRRALKNTEAGLDVDISEYERYLDDADEEVLPHIKRCVARWIGKPLPFPEINAQRNLIAMGALEIMCGYNNNILAAVKKSRVVMIILREIRRRYKFIFKYGFDGKPNASVSPEHYLYRLSNYRYDALDGRENVTLFLTGPILVLEVLLGVAYEILSLDKSISAQAVSCALRLDCIAVACREHTCYTPEHMRSSWM